MRVGALLLLCGFAVAEDPLAARVDEILVAVRRADARALDELAARPDLDPWLVADELRARGEREAAEAFAGAVPGGERIGGAVRRLRSVPDDARARAALARANRVLRAPEPAEFQATLEGLGSTADDLLTVRLESARGQLARQVGAQEESEASFLRAAAGAEALGWTARQVVMEREALVSRLNRLGLEGARDMILGCLARAEELGDRPAIAWTSHLLGQCHAAARQADEAIRCLERSAALWKEVGAPAEEAGSLRELYALLMSRGEPRRALDVARKERAAREAAGDRPGAVGAQSNIADQLNVLGQIEEAADAYVQVADEARASGDLQSEANAWSGLAGIRLKQGRLDDAGALADRGVERATASGAARALIHAKNMVADVRMYRGRYREAAEVYGEALEIARAEKDPWRETIILGNLAGAYEQAGDLPAALATHDDCLSRCRAMGDRAGEAFALSTRGHVLLRMGRPAEAKASCEAALAMDDPDTTPSTLARLGLIHEKLGDFARAFQYLERALKAARDHGDLRLVGSTLNLTGNACFRVGELDRALSYYQQALGLARDIGDPRGTGLVLGNIGLVHASRDPAVAAAWLRDALRFNEESGHVGNIVEASLGLAGTLIQLGEFDEADGHVRRAISLAESSGSWPATVTGRLMLAKTTRLRGRSRDSLPLLLDGVAQARAMGELPLLVQALAELVASYCDLGEWEHAIAASREAALLLATLVGNLEEEQSATAREGHGGAIGGGVFAALRASRTEDAFFLVEWGRAGAFLEALGGRERLRDAAATPELLMAEEEARAGERAAVTAHQEALSTGVRAVITERRAELERAREELAAIAARAGREARLATRMTYPSPASLEEVRGALRPGETLVLYAFAGDRLAALVVDPAGPRLVDLGTAEPVAAACAALVRGGPLPAANAVRALILDPLGLPEAAESLLISPDGALGDVPFCLLDGKRNVSFVPSATALVAMRRGKAEPGTGVLAVGDPKVPGAAPLPGARAEAKALGDVVLLGAEATEARLAAAAGLRPRWRALHFACHGQPHPRLPGLSALRLAPEGDSDGALTVIEIARLRLDSDLVTLSACDTAPGALRAAEGVSGFPRAFLFAGASRVLVSLWKVDDTATRMLMERFYAHWREMPAAAALRAAQRDMRELPAGKDPSAWAAWQLWGLPE